MKKILVKEITGKLIMTRQEILELMKKILESKEKEIELNFSDTKFLNLSPTDEYFKMKEKLEKEGYIIKETNLNQDLSIFLKIKNSISSN